MEERMQKVVKRSQTSAEERQAHINNWKASGMKMSAYCRQHGLALSSFSGWTQAILKKEPHFKAVTINKKLPIQESKAPIVEILVGQDIKIRLLNVTDSLFIVHLIKELR